MPWPAVAGAAARAAAKAAAKRAAKKKGKKKGKVKKAAATASAVDLGMTAPSSTVQAGLPGVAGPKGHPAQYEYYRSKFKSKGKSRDMRYMSKKQRKRVLRKTGRK